MSRPAVEHKSPGQGVDEPLPQQNATGPLAVLPRANPCANQSQKPRQPPVEKPARKQGRRSLRHHAPRLLGRHDGADGRAYSRHYAALEGRFGPFDALTRPYAGAAAIFWLQFQRATRGLKEAEETRLKGKGRRPNTAAIERLKRRQGLSWGTYDQAVRRLAELAQKPNGDGADPLDAVQRAVEAANQP